jgi:hypothetical protein
LTLGFIGTAPGMLHVAFHICVCMLAGRIMLHERAVQTFSSFLHTWQVKWRRVVQQLVTAVCSRAILGHCAVWQLLLRHAET